MFDIIPAAVRNVIDSIFNAPIGWLVLMRDMLNNAGTVTGKGINLNHYFSFFGYLPPEWQVCVKSALSGVVLLMVLWLVKAAWNSYLNLKGSIQWW